MKKVIGSARTRTASARSLVIAANALSNSSGPRTHDVPHLAQALPHGFRGTGPQKTDSEHPPRLLRLTGKRRGEDADRAGDEGSTVHYWITWSARASTAGGIVRPRAFAVFSRVEDWRKAP
jgi:hypothetical protein